MNKLDPLPQSCWMPHPQEGVLQMECKEKSREREGSQVFIMAEQETRSYCCPVRGDNQVSRVMFNSKQASNFWIIFPSMWSQFVWLFIHFCKLRSLSDRFHHSYFHTYHILKKLTLRDSKFVPHNLNCPFSTLWQDFFFFYFLTFVFTQISSLQPLPASL